MPRSSDLISLELSPHDFPLTWEAMRSAIAEGVTPGLVAGLWQKASPNEARIAAVGQRRLVPSVLPMLPTTVFDLASVTKVFATATLTALLVDRGWIGWHTPLKSLLADFPHSDVRLHHLLSHTAGFKNWEPFYETLNAHFAPTPIWKVAVADRQKEMRKLVLQSPLEVQPGTRTLYSDISSILLGFALEEVLKLPLDVAVQNWVWRPMGLHTAHFNRVTQSAEKGRDETVAATELCPWRGQVIQGQVHDDNAWAMGGYAGHAGAFATAQDVLKFAHALFNGFLSPRTLKEAWTKISEPMGCTRTLGWDTPSGPNPSASALFGKNTVGHLGFTGTSLWIDPDAGIAVTLLTNRVHPTRENKKIVEFRPKFHQALRTDLGR
jgi:serine-type D-Ala-D-Ala carboxypeptidase